MATDTAYMRTMRRAIATLGGAEQLASALGASVVEIETWAAGHADPPPSMFLKAIDIVSKVWTAPRAAKS